MTLEEKEQWDIFMQIWVIPALKNTWGEKKCKEIVEALEEWEEQGSVLDKITTEIMQLDYDLESVDYDYNDMPQTEVVHMICREEVLQIIDKHKESEEDKND